eukprot:3998664-Prymnesium_polylepis.1
MLRRGLRRCRLLRRCPLMTWRRHAAIRRAVCALPVQLRAAAVRAAICARAVCTAVCAHAVCATIGVAGA